MYKPSVLESLNFYLYSFGIALVWMLQTSIDVEQYLFIFHKIIKIQTYCQYVLSLKIDYAHVLCFLLKFVFLLYIALWQILYF